MDLSRGVGDLVGLMKSPPTSIPNLAYRKIVEFFMPSNSPKDSRIQVSLKNFGSL
jgi:hypothetical protein